MYPALTRHRWTDLVMAFWRRDVSELAALVPPGVRPDEIDGSGWVALSAYVFRDTTIPPLPPPPGRLGTLTEIALEVLTVDDEGRHGTAYRTIETDHLPAIVLARIGIGVPYRPARAGTRRGDDGRVEHRSRRAASGPGGPSLRVAARPASASAGHVADSLAARLANRDGIHARHLGRTAFWERDHAPLALRPAELERVEGDLADAVGLEGLLDAPPELAVLAQPTVVEYRWGGLLPATSSPRG